MENPQKRALGVLQSVDSNSATISKPQSQRPPAAATANSTVDHGTKAAQQRHVREAKWQQDDFEKKYSDKTRGAKGEDKPVKMDVNQSTSQGLSLTITVGDAKKHSVQTKGPPSSFLRRQKEFEQKRAQKLQMNYTDTTQTNELSESTMKERSHVSQTNKSWTTMKKASATSTFAKTLNQSKNLSGRKLAARRAAKALEESKQKTQQAPTWSETLAYALINWMNTLFNNSKARDAILNMEEFTKSINNILTKQQKTKSQQSQRAIEFFANGFPKTKLLAKDNNGALVVAIKKTKQSWNNNYTPQYSALFDLPLWRETWEHHQTGGSIQELVALDSTARSEKDEEDGIQKAKSEALLQWRRRLRELRQHAFQVYSEPPAKEDINADIPSVMESVNVEIEEGSLAFRHEMDVQSDTTIRESLTTLLLHFHPAWLRLGLETVMGEEIKFPPGSTYDGGYPALRRFIHTSFLQCHSASEAFAKTKKGKWDERVKIAQNRYILQRFLGLILFLDNAARMDLFRQHDIYLEQNSEHCLFATASKMKSTKELLQSLSRDFLAHEGDILKHLQGVGYTACYVQDSYDEYSLHIPDPKTAAKEYLYYEHGEGAHIPPASIPSAKDLLSHCLKDGYRLARVIECLQNEERQKLARMHTRLPAENRTKKLHNIRNILDLLADQGVLKDNKHGKKPFQAEELVKPDPDKSLALLWLIISHFHLPDTIPYDRLEKELTQLKAHDTAVKDDKTDIGSPTVMDSRAEDPVCILWKWCKAVCDIQNVHIESWMSGFSNGLALSCIINYYRPDLLASVESSDMSDSNPKAIRRRWKIALEACAALGCSFLSPFIPDGSECVDERLIIMLVSVLSSRLILSSKETKAAMVIQRNWKLVNSVKASKRFRKVYKAKLVFSVVRLEWWWKWQQQFQQQRRQRKYASTLQAWWRMHLLRCFLNKERQLKAVLDTVMRKRAARKVQVKATRYRDAVVIQLQSWYRGVVQRRRYSGMYSKVQKCQAVTRGYLFRYVYKQKLSKLRKSSDLIKRSLRVVSQRRRFAELKKCTVKIQTWWRTEQAYYLQWKELRHSAALLIQISVREWLDRLSKEQEQNEYLRKAAATLIQCAMRDWVQYKSWKTMRAAICKLQATVRATSSRQLFLSKRRSAINIQSWYRMKQQTIAFELQRNATTHISCWWKSKCVQYSHPTVKEYLPPVLQDVVWSRARASKLTAFRAYRAVRKFLVKHSHTLCTSRGTKAVMTLQAAYRGFKERQQIASEDKTGRVAAVASRAVEANENAFSGVSETLYERTRKSYTILTCQHSLQSVRNACSELAVTVSLSEKCAAELTRRKVGPQLFALLRGCSRKEEHQQLAVSILEVLRQLLQRHACRGHICNCMESTDILVDLIQMFRDKWDVISSSVEVLHDILKLSIDRRQAITSKPDTVRRLDSLHKIISRKSRSVERTQFIGSNWLRRLTGLGASPSSPKSPMTIRMETLVVSLGGRGHADEEPRSIAGHLESVVKLVM